jgi:hypothetical protein
MLVHTCRCIISFVLIGFISKRKGFQKLLENAFKILEKENKIEILSFLNFWPEALLLFLLISACSAFSPPQLSSPCARVTGRPSSPQAEATRLSPLLVSLPPWGHLSGSPLSSFSRS